MNKPKFLTVPLYCCLVCCTPIIALFLSWTGYFVHADTVESDFNRKICQVIHAPGNLNQVVMEVPDKKTLTIKDGIVTFIDVNGNQLWVSQPFIVRVPEQAERRFE